VEPGEIVDPALIKYTISSGSYIPDSSTASLHNSAHYNG